MAGSWLDPQWRRTVLALVFAASGAVLTLFSVWLAWNILNAPWPAALANARLNIIGAALYAVLGLMALANWVGRKRDWAVATWPGRATST